MWNDLKNFCGWRTIYCLLTNFILTLAFTVSINHQTFANGISSSVYERNYMKWILCSMKKKNIFLNRFLVFNKYNIRIIFTRRSSVDEDVILAILVKFMHHWTCFKLVEEKIFFTVVSKADNNYQILNNWKITDHLRKAYWFPN